MDNAHRTVQTFTPLQADNILGALVPSSVAAIASEKWLQIGIGKRFGSVVDFKSECFDLMICHYFEWSCGTDTPADFRIRPERTFYTLLFYEKEEKGEKV